MSAFYSSVDCKEVPGTVFEEISAQNGITCGVRLQCAWTDRYALLDDILGTPKPWPYITTGFIPYPVTGRAISLPGEAWGTTTGQECTFEDAYVDFTYSTQMVESASESIDPTMESIPLDYRNFLWGSGTVGAITEGEAPTKILRSCNLTRTIYRQAVVPVETISMIGYCNQADYTSEILGGLVFPAETLLFLPGGMQRSFKGLALSEGYTVTLKFGFKPQGWNKYWNANIQDWDYLFLRSDLVNPYRSYPKGDFSAFFA